MDIRPAVPGAPAPAPPAGRCRALAVGAVVAALAASGTAGYTIRPGETLSHIALRTGVSTRELVSANGLGDPDRIYAGDALEVPAASGGTGADSRAGADSGTAAPRAPRAAASRAEVGALIERTARRYGWNPATVKALAWQESGWRQDVVSPDGAVGIMQVLPSTGRWLSEYVVGRELDLSDAEDNVEAGVAFLDHLYGVTGGDVRRTIGGYYQGLASLDGRGAYDDTRVYVDNVLILRERFSRG